MTKKESNIARAAFGVLLRAGQRFFDWILARDRAEPRNDGTRFHFIIQMARGKDDHAI